ncbi:MAG: phosphotransferase family protein [Acidimicrobiia bacterium]|nr:phosphotransferase family protein [Acidimicrobiia bacterium]
MPIPQQRDPEDTRRRLTAWLAERMPEARDLTLTTPHGPTDTGFSSDTLLFEATWTEGGEDRRGDFVARAEPTGYTVFPEYDLGLQFRVVEALDRHTGVPVPRVFWLEEDAAVLGSPFYLMERVEGRIPPDSPPYTLEGWVLEASPEERRRLWTHGLEVLARIHDVDWKGLGFDVLDRAELGRAGLDQQLTEAERYLEWVDPGRCQPIVEAGLDWLRANRPAEDGPVGLCWGDARIGNMIFRDGTCFAVLDWEMVSLGNPVQDLAWWLHLHRHHSEGLGVESPEGFPDRDETVAIYEAASGRPVRDLEYYEMFAAFRFAVIMMRIARMMVEFDLIPPDSDYERTNTASCLLAGMLGLPAPT